VVPRPRARLRVRELLKPPALRALTLLSIELTRGNISFNRNGLIRLVERVRLDVEEANRQEARVELLVAEHEAPLKIAEDTALPVLPGRGRRLPAHLFLPALVPGEQIDP
jgi:hypothetical protein